jgi:hypothetical protein
VLKMTASVNTIDSQRCVCRTHLFQFNGTSSPKRARNGGDGPHYPSVGNCGATQDFRHFGSTVSRRRSCGPPPDHDS